ncbi:MAG: hypothetical protein EBX99_10090 [Acidimicrobiia bacterium]|nr:hypothetical protein [Actinomycetota bacterium]NDB06085.1 hypothetical protein [Acidimicrobiia bacterium]NDE57812.1 hypothetical protein [Acidimicrobiia bacterium]NDF30676.1 hypothetical protein [Acidimicrobiia bacterium]NDH48165.1 hypothetical protein [Acidimicrobiia bacterium]
MKAHLTLKYRPLSDTVLGFVEGLTPDAGESSTLPDISSTVVRDRLDADTTVEWAPIDGVDVLVGFQQLHASVRPRVEGLPGLIGVLVTELILKAKDDEDTEDVVGGPASILRSFEMRHDVDVTMLVKPVVVRERVRAPRATTKGVEAALHHMIDRAEVNEDDSSRPALAALRDLAASIGDGEGLSSERTAEAAFQAISSSGMRSRQQQTAWLNVVNDLRDQRTWSRAIQSAMSAPDSDAMSELDAAKNDDD